MPEVINSWDIRIILAVQEHLRSPIMDTLMKFISSIGNAGIIWIAIGLFMLCFKKTRKGGFYMLISLALATAANNLIVKPLVGRARPYSDIENIIVLITPLKSSSFPSGHSCSSFASATALFIALQKHHILRLLPYGPAVLIAFSRVYVGVHYLSDVICGSLLGACIAVLIFILFQKIPKLKFDEHTHT